MALAHITWFSKALAKMVQMNVILPEEGTGPFAVMYLLHGLSDDYTAWQRRTRIEWYVRNLPLIVVMADGGRGFYTNNQAGPPYATFFAEELPAFVERNFPARTDRRYIAGNSMGGYGALRLALGYPDRYAGAFSHSGAVLNWRYDPTLTSLGPDEHRRIFGANADGTQHDLLALAGKARQGAMPRLHLDCGTEDFLIGANRSFTAQLREMGVDHTYMEHPGAHDWDYWDLQVRNALELTI